MVPKAFLEALAETFDEHGRAAVRHVRDNDPAEYARAFASIIPRDAATGDIYSDAQLEALRRTRRAACQGSPERGRDDSLSAVVVSG